ncbi:serine carboxypeptidase-like 18 [Quercus suber]|uniref:Serine carboxypeptidase-like 18 n=1 Tax=Quercus suber TaxID=58331 RepID=A0AAW0K413_QUESU
MARLGSIFSHNSLYLLHMLVLLLLLQACPQIAFSHSMVKFLPGFQGPLPFELETGYVGVGESEEVQLFYYFVKSESNPKEDPLVLWLTGGPGCSAWSGLVFEIGPLNFKVEEYNGSLPKLVLNPYSWTKVSSIIFVDSPVGTGFSYAKNWIADRSDDFKQAHQLHQFLIRGYLLGNPVTDLVSDGNSAIPYAHGLGLISDELHESLKRTCGGEYLRINPENAECMQHVQEFYECLSGINTAQILEPSCSFASPKPHAMFDKRRSLYENLKAFLNSDSSDPQLGCRSYGYLLSRYWANDDDVRKALQIQQGSIGEWQRCKYELYYTQDSASSFVGDHDITVPFLGTQAWIRSLNYSIVDDWRSWNVQGQVAGYTRTYSNKMTFATGGGHTAPEYKPKECFTMFKRWTSHEPL